MKVVSSIKAKKRRSQTGLQVVTRRNRKGKIVKYVISKVGGRFKCRQG